MWVSSSGKYLQIPLDTERWVERACQVVGRDLTEEEWERFVPGDEAPRPACDIGEPMTVTAPHDLEPLVHDDAPPPSFIARTAARLSTWKWWVASTTVFVSFAAVFFGTRAPFSIQSVESACGLAPPDVRFTSSAAEVNGFLVACGEPGRSAYTNLQIADLFYPAVFGLFLATSLAVALRRLGVGGRFALAAMTLPMLGAAFDYLENVFAWRALAAFPEPTGTDGLLGLATAAKTTTFWFAGLSLLVAVATLGVRTIRRRLGRAFRRVAMSIEAT
jgi:hypothetical protein